MGFSFNEYFDDFEVKDRFKKEFISLWTGWLGKENSHQLDEVTESDWSRFNSLIKLIFKNYRMQIVDLRERKLNDINKIEETFSNYKDSMNKTTDKFSIYVIPELECIISEDWDYTYIIWYTNKTVIEKLEPFIEKSGLHHFS
ncbi:hypothetical protein NAL32_09800 [Chryseobacterium sp. Ch-15]|uniref:Uncharacterized protein n=1 Tax=Chryseobacterium muglaense TaxID=2893752 RepID=A0A9Q3UWA4_9FLAO|nr:hypothetical protein [Chryseobacterium muglaense]MBD3904955.1 hypothetical protein [Chryseobacterium muglaense]MCC9035178.1 hypothetical protein [Chryseobacterium muglaense]MCM2554677.1 hypothetical protein [Chryseobacterium muglaense]